MSILLEVLPSLPELIACGGHDGLVNLLQLYLPVARFVDQEVAMELPKGTVRRVSSRLSSGNVKGVPMLSASANLVELVVPKIRRDAASTTRLAMATKDPLFSASLESFVPSAAVVPNPVHAEAASAAPLLFATASDVSDTSMPFNMSPLLRSRVASYAIAAWGGPASGAKGYARVASFAVNSASVNAKLAHCTPVGDALVALLQLNALLRRLYPSEIASVMGRIQALPPVEESAAYELLLRLSQSLLNVSRFDADWIMLRVLELKFVETTLQWLVEPLMARRFNAQAYDVSLWIAYFALAASVLTQKDLDVATCSHEARVAYMAASYGASEPRVCVAAQVDRVWQRLGDRRIDIMQNWVLTCLELAQCTVSAVLRERAIQWYFDLLLVEFARNPTVARLQFFTIEAINAVSTRLAAISAASVSAGNSSFEPSKAISRLLRFFAHDLRLRLAHEPNSAVLVPQLDPVLHDLHQFCAHITSLQSFGSNLVSEAQRTSALVKLMGYLSSVHTLCVDALC